MEHNLKTSQITNGGELKLNKQNRTLEHYISSERVNEYCYKLRSKGMNDKDYRNNPQVLYLHFAGDNWFSAPAKPSDTVIGTNLSLTKHNDGFISAVTQFADSELGEEVMQFNASGLLNAWSLRWGWNNSNNIDKDIEEKDGVLTVLNWNLKEYSSCPIPANPDATNRLALSQMLSETKLPLLQQSLSGAILQTDFNIELNKLKADYDKKLSDIESKLTGEVTKKDLTDLKAEVLSKMGDIRKNLMDSVITLALDIHNFKGNFDKQSLMKMSEIADKRIRNYAGKID